MQRKLIHNVQVLRFIAAAGVVLSHQADLLIPHDPANRWFWAVPWTAGVDLFFVISGFVMLLLTHDAFGREGAAADFLKRRILRIVPPYWFFTTLTVAAVIAAGGRLGGTTVDLPQLLTSYSFLPWPRADGLINPILGQGWTLNYEAFFYAAFALALLSRRGLFALCAVFLMLALVHPWVPRWLFMIRFWTSPIILEFVAGIILARIYLAGVRVPQLGSYALLGLAVVTYALAGQQNFGFLDRFASVGIPAALLSASLILAPEPGRVGTFRRLLQRGGDASYTIYLAHYMIVHAFALLWKKLGIGLPWLGVGIGVTGAIVSAMVFYAVVERPVTQALQRKLGRSGGELQRVAP
jgi:peptidoglycan/LPS O-acetylase OafA/YrhL